MFSHRRIRNENFSYGVREFDCYRLAFAKTARIVIKLRKPHDILGDKFNRGASVLDINTQWYGSFPAVICCYTRFKRALLRVGGGLHLHLKQRFEGAIDPGKSQV
jgi:hypothetical protein